MAVNKEKVPSDQTYKKPDSKSKEKIKNESEKTPELKSRETPPKDFFIPSPVSRETPSLDFSIPSPTSKENIILGARNVANIQSKETIILNPFASPKVE